MSQTRARLLAALPGYFDKDPAAAAAFALAYDGAALVTLVDRELTIVATGGSDVAGRVIKLNGLTLGALADLFNAAPGYAATVLGDPDSSALMLLDVAAQPLNTDPILRQFTSTLWGVLTPVAWAIDATIRNVRDGLLEMVTSTADGPWVDLWGTIYYGGVARRPSEADRAYADRIIREVLRLRANSRAIELIILEELGVHAEIINLHDLAWVMSRTVWGYLAAFKYQRTEFQVIVDDIVAGLELLVDRNRAAGTLPFYRYQSTAGVFETERVEAPAIILAAARIGSDLVWVMSQSRMGYAYLARPGNVGVASQYLSLLAGEQVLPSGFPAFLLGTAELAGDFALGGDSSGGGTGVTIEDAMARIGGA